MEAGKKDNRGRYPHKIRRTLLDRFLAKVELGANLDACWSWTGATQNGYGVIGLGRRTDGLDRAHRVSFSTFIGPIPDGLFVCHRCDNRRCCNPRHLFLGTNADNVADMMSKGRQQRGERQGHARLTETQVREVLNSSEHPVSIARRFGVSRATIEHIKKRRTWKHVA